MRRGQLHDPQPATLLRYSTRLLRWDNHEENNINGGGGDNDYDDDDDGTKAPTSELKWQLSSMVEETRRLYCWRRRKCVYGGMAQHRNRDEASKADGDDRHGIGHL